MGCIEQKLTILFVGSWSWVPVLQFFCQLFLQRHPFVKVSRGGCWLSFSFFCISLVALFLVKVAKWEKSAICRVWAFPSFSNFSIVCIYVGKIVIGSFLCPETFLSLVSAVNLQGIMHLKSSKLRKSCKYQCDTKNRHVCKPEKKNVAFQVVTFISSQGTLYIYTVYNIFIRT